MTTTESPPKLRLDALGKIILHADPDALRPLVDMHHVLVWTRLDTQLEDAAARRLPDLYYSVDADSETYAAVIEVQVRSRRDMTRRPSGVADLLADARALNPADHPQPVIYV